MERIDTRHRESGTIGSLSRQMRTSAAGASGSIVLLGLPGAGKTTQATLIGDRFSMPMVSTGELVRTIAREQSARGEQFRDLLARGELIPDELMFPLFRDAVAEHPGGLVIDGFPRTLVQASGLSAVLPTIRRVILLDLSIPEAMGRLLARQRDDDTPQAILRRMTVFTEETAPVATFYGNRKLLTSIEASGSIDEVTERVIECANLRDPQEASASDERRALRTQ